MPKTKEAKRAAAWGSAVTIVTFTLDLFVTPNRVILAALLVSLGVCLAFTAYYYGWLARSIKGPIAALVVIAVPGAIGIILWPTSVPKLVAVELSPFVSTFPEKRGPPGRESLGMRYGLTAIVRIETNPPAQVRRLDVIGDVAVDCAEYEMAFIKVGQPLGAYEEQCIKCKPFRRISWIAWPQPEEHGQIPQREQFVKFVIKEPGNLGSRMQEAPAEDYVGCGDQNQKPGILTTDAHLEDLIYFTAVTDAESGSSAKRFLGPRLRKEIEIGKVQFRVQFDSRTALISPESVRKIRIVAPEQWANSPSQELFYATDPWNRVFPATRDLTMESSSKK